MIVAFIDGHRAQFGVEPICRVLPIAPSTYFKRKAEERDPMRRSPEGAEHGEATAAKRELISTGSDKPYV